MTMRLANSSRTLLPLALSAVLATCALAQEHPNVQPNAVRDQLMKQTPGESQPQTAPTTPAPSAAKRPDPATAKAPAKGPAKAPAAGKGATKEPSGNSAKAPIEKPAEVKTPVARRDPFDTLLTKARAGNAPPENLPPGKAGLIVETLRIDGIVRGPNGMIAIVSNSQQRVYFLREGDKLYDGSVEKIALDAISFHEIGKDAFGKPLERVVTKRLYPSPGEQQ
jgi:Tfp pilus assembly protein PilP